MTDAQIAGQLAYYGVPADEVAEVTEVFKEYLDFNPDLDIAEWVESYMALNS